MKTTGGKPRNWAATNLRHHKPKRIEDKRDRERWDALWAQMDEADMMLGGMDLGPLSHDERNRLLFGD